MELMLLNFFFQLDPLFWRNEFDGIHVFEFHFDLVHFFVKVGLSELMFLKFVQVVPFFWKTGFDGIYFYAMLFLIVPLFGKMSWMDLIKIDLMKIIFGKFV